MNRKAMVLLVVVVALVPVYLGAAWWCGKATRNGFDEVERSMAAESSHLFRVVERKSSGGLLSSTEEFTIEVGGAAPDALVGSSAPSGEVTFRRVADEGAEAVAGEEDLSMEEMQEMAGEEMEQSHSPARKPVRFVLHNDIKHGPLPGFTSLGVARVDTRLVFDEETRAEIAKVIGDQDPLTLVTRVGLLGGASMKLTSPAFEFEREGSKIAWQGIDGRVDFGRRLDSIDCDVRMPGISAKEPAGKEFSMSDLSLTCDMERAFEVLYTGEMSFQVDSMKGSEGNRPFSIQDAHYDAKIGADGDYMDFALRLGLGATQSPELSFEDLQYHLTLTHLHGPTVAALSREMKSLQQAAAEAGTPNPMAGMQALMTHGPKLLEHAPVLVVDNIGMKMASGEFSLKAQAQIIDFAAADLEAGPQALLAKLEATADVALDEAMAAQFAAMQQRSASPDAPQVDRAAALQQQLQAMEQAGYLKRNGGTLQAHLEYRNGALTVNGKPLGGPPPPQQ